MFTHISRFILKHRTFIIIVLALLTAFMGFNGKDAKLSYENSSLLPEKDSTRMEYIKFKNQFGEDGNVIVIGTVNPDLFNFWRI